MEKMKAEVIPRFMTIREVARTKILPEHCLRELVKENQLPTCVIRTGNRTLINYDLLLEKLNTHKEVD